MLDLTVKKYSEKASGLAAWIIREYTRIVFLFCNSSADFRF